MARCNNNNTTNQQEIENRHTSRGNACAGICQDIHGCKFWQTRFFFKKKHQQQKEFKKCLKKPKHENCKFTHCSFTLTCTGLLDCPTLAAPHSSWPPHGKPPAAHFPPPLAHWPKPQIGVANFGGQQVRPGTCGLGGGQGLGLGLGGPAPGPGGGRGPAPGPSGAGATTCSRSRAAPLGSGGGSAGRE